MPPCYDSSVPTIHGIVPAMITPMRDDERVDYTAWQNLIDTLITAGVDGVFCGGSSGEFFALEPEERQVSLRFARQAVNGRVPVYGNVGCITTRDTVALARFAEAEGIDIIVVITPYYLKATQDELADHFVEVCNAVRKPVLAYNFPPHGAPELEAATLGRIAARCENLVGVKDSSGRLELGIAYRDCAPGRKLPVLVGPENLIVQALDNQLTGTVTALANIAPRLFVDLYRAYRENRRADAERLQGLVDGMCSWVLAHTFPSMIKEGMRMVGRPVGACRKPIGAVPPEARNRLAAGLEQLRQEGYLDEPTGRGTQPISAPARA
jgi:4-hydroxy-tetrahydrodipicolinate synthase